MRLELGLIHIKDVCFGQRTAVADHTLTIDRAELTALLAEELLFESIEVVVARPGESCRIIHVLDILEPRYRLEGPNFPGALDPMGLVGAGRTMVLRNVCVVETSPHGRGRSIVDMSGPATAYSPFGATHNIVLIPHPARGADRDEVRLAIKKAGLKAAVYLAAAAKNVGADETKIYDLPPAAFNREPGRLPRIGYIFPIHSQQHPTHQRENVFYGSNIQGFMPTIVHPNEILDGALMFSYSAFTYFAQNHPVIEELYRRHGRDLCFAGVVATVAPVTVTEKQRNAYLAARLAKEVLGVEGVVATKIGGGAVDTDLMMMYERCEELGMKAALIIMERYPDTGITFVPAGVDALVTPGLTRDAITLPRVQRVVGGETLLLDNANPDNTDPGIPPLPADQELRLWIGDIAGAISQVGASRLTTYAG